MPPLLQRAVCLVRGFAGDVGSVAVFVGAFVVAFVVVFAAAFASVFDRAFVFGVAVLGAEAFGATTFGVVVFAFLTAVVLLSSFAFLFVPAVAFVSALATGVFAIGLLLVAPFFVSRSFFVHSFLSLVSSLVTLAGTFRFPALTASKSRMRATDFVFEGWRP
jgi:hypothetical protein